jgi:pimeloyl-ACP methyl ester carboxylesterase
MGGNVVMLYAGVRPQRVRRLVNLEGFGMPATQPQQAPAAPGAVAGRAEDARAAAPLRRPGRGGRPADGQRPAADARQGRLAGAALGRAGDADGRWQLLADPAHKRVNPVLYHVDEVLETWKPSPRRCCGWKAT